ncbi:MAG: hypothetical protein HYU57_01135 [Micavibrio aeruginosavorus]|nr:hypothetical protein [Micavibrio aeruginosavorus]
MKHTFFLTVLFFLCFLLGCLLGGGLQAKAEGLNEQNNQPYDFVFAKGLRSMPDLHIAMASDKVLYADVSRLKRHTFEDFLNTRLDLEGDVENILFRWAGVSNIDQSARGPNIDARALALLEQINRKSFVQTGEGAEGEVNPMFWASVGLQQAYHIVFSQYFSLIMGQSAARDLFTGSIGYTAEEFGRLTGITGIEASAIAKVTSAARALDDDEKKYFLWGRVLRVIDDTINIAYLNNDQKALLYYAVTQSGIDWETAFERMDYLHPRDMRGSFYAENVLGMTVKDCNLVKLFDEARKRSSAREIIINNLVTKLLGKCATSEETALELFRKNGFDSQDVTSDYNQREMFGNRTPYERVYIASNITKKNRLLAFLMIPYDLYFAQLYVRNGRVEWATGIVNRPQN